MKQLPDLFSPQIQFHLELWIPVILYEDARKLCYGQYLGYLELQAHSEGECIPHNLNVIANIMLDTLSHEKIFSL